MRKIYDSWHRLKDAVQSVDIRLIFNEQEIWSCYFGCNIGAEQDGSGEDFMRPAVIVRKFNKNMCWVIPLTRNPKDSEFYFLFSFIANEPSTAILSQMRPIDAKRLIKRLGYMNERQFMRLKQRLKALLP